MSIVLPITVWLLAVALGVALIIAIASWRGVPVSTTHGLVGAVAGAGASGKQDGVDRQVFKVIV